MRAYSIIVDSRLMGARLPRCLATLHEAVRRYPAKVDIQVIGTAENARLATLSRRFGGRFIVCDYPTFGARSNAMHAIEIVYFLSRMSYRVSGATASLSAARATLAAVSVIRAAVWAMAAGGKTGRAAAAEEDEGEEGG